MPKFEGLVPGRIVRFVIQGGAILPAVVITADQETSLVNLGVFGVQYNFFAEVSYSEKQLRGTWHWPPKT